MESEFCPSLQISWYLDNISIRELGEIQITVKGISSLDYPSPIGQYGKAVISYPSILSENNLTEFNFHRCTYFNVRDDSSPGYSEHDRGEGKTFQRLLNSELISAHCDRGIEEVFHYRIICVNEIIDVVCYEAPIIIQKSTV
jgi:hypothetical protein